MKSSIRRLVRAKFKVCQRCGCNGVKGNPLTVHHIKPQHSHPELANDPNNMTLLCRKCHDEIHGITHGEVDRAKPDGKPRKKSRYWISQMEEGDEKVSV